ncbi:hypothetical protein ACT4ML_08085 [Natrinema sp. LN54]|uniref:hypothetical protein n=1 Tax=Natrinema sp. LN54 TaxID=3458705 RepID=UPI0040356E9D
MKRRVLLGAVTTGIAAVAGCLSDSGSDNPNDHTENEPTNDDEGQDDNSNPYNQPAEYDEVKNLTVQNNLNATLNGSVTVIDNDEDATLSETNITIQAGERVRDRIPTADESGNYTVKVTVDGRGTVADDFNLRTPVGEPHLYISESRDDDEPFSVGVDGAPSV